MAPTTRRAKVTDAQALALAHVRAWQVAYEGIVPQQFLNSLDLEHREVQWRQFLGTDVPTDYVVEVDGRVVGFANVGPFRDQLVNQAAGELWAMYVHPDYWGTACGFALMQTTFDHFAEQSVETGYLWVLDRNDQARRFYERQGWTADDLTKEDSVGGIMLTERRYSIDLG